MIMLTDLENSNHSSTFHIIKFIEGWQNVYFQVDINEHGFVKADILFPEEINVERILPNLQKIHYHSIELSEPTILELAKNVRIKVAFTEFTKQMILEADDQCWYVGIEDDSRKNFYYQGTLKLLLFENTHHEVHNGDAGKEIYPSFYDAQFRFFSLLRSKKYNQNFHSQVEKEAYQQWEEREYKLRSNEYFRLMHYSHPKRYDGPSETFAKWREETEANQQKVLERKEKDLSKS
jgi:hypothetical protein